MTIKPKLEYYKCGYFQGCFHVIIFFNLKTRQIYLQTWPLEAKLGMIFPENRIIKATKFAQKFMPFMAVFAVSGSNFIPKQILLHFRLLF